MQQYLKRIAKYMPRGIRDFMQKHDSEPKIGFEIVF